MSRANVARVNRAEMAEVLEEFASELFETRDPDANARAAVIDIRAAGWPTEEYERPDEPPFNAVAIIEVQSRGAGADSEEAATFAAILRGALEADPRLGGRIEAKVRVLPLDKNDPGQVRALIHIDDP
jgi:hypothetical protein